MGEEARAGGTSIWLGRSACPAPGMGHPRTAGLTAACFPRRKKVLDFYQRACLSGYCSAFAYKPMSCSLSSQLNGKCIELVQAPGQSSIFTVCELPSTVPIKLSTRRNSWSSDGTMRGHPRGARHGEDFPRAMESSRAEGTVGTALDLERRGGTHSLVTWAGPFVFSWIARCFLCPPPGSLVCSSGIICTKALYLKVINQQHF